MARVWHLCVKFKLQDLSLYQQMIMYFFIFRMPVPLATTQTTQSTLTTMMNMTIKCSCLFNNFCNNINNYYKNHFRTFSWLSQISIFSYHNNHNWTNNDVVLSVQKIDICDKNLEVNQVYKWLCTFILDSLINHMDFKIR